MSGPCVKSDDQWEIDSAAESIIRAQEIRADKKLWPKVQKALRKKAEAAHRAVMETRASKGLKKVFSP